MKKILAVVCMLAILLTLCSCSPKKVDKVSGDSESSGNKVNKTITTDCFTLELNEYWVANAGYDTFVSEAVDLGILFYDKASYQADGSGTLFGIYVEPIREIPYPSYELLGSLTYNGEPHNVIVYYPSDVQFTEKTAKTYNRLHSEIPEILKSIVYKESCNFKEKQ